jgi:hypothetical protein
MSVHPHLAALAGEWKGTNRLNLSWLPDPIRESASTAVVVPRAAGQALGIAYTWEYEGQPHEGLILICGAKDSSIVSATWTDSWHSAHTLMHCAGTVSENGAINVKGSYAVPDHPDWGWRTEIIPSSDTFKYLMFNLTPEGEEEWAVETEFHRV